MPFIHNRSQSISHQNGVDDVVRVGCNIDTVHAVSSSNSVYYLFGVYRQIPGSQKAVCEHPTQAFRGEFLDYIFYKYFWVIFKGQYSLLTYVIWIIITILRCFYLSWILLRKSVVFLPNLQCKG